MTVGTSGLVAIADISSRYSLPLLTFPPASPPILKGFCGRGTWSEGCR